MKNFSYFLGGSHLFGDSFLIFKENTWNSWKSQYKQHQVLIMVFNKKALVNISNISNSKNPPWNLLKFVLRIVVNECLSQNEVGFYKQILSNIYMCLFPSEVLLQLKDLPKNIYKNKCREGEINTIFISPCLFTLNALIQFK